MALVPYTPQQPITQRTSALRNVCWAIGNCSLWNHDAQRCCRLEQRCYGQRRRKKCQRCKSVINRSAARIYICHKMIGCSESAACVTSVVKFFSEYPRVTNENISSLHSSTDQSKLYGGTIIVAWTFFNGFASTSFLQLDGWASKQGTEKIILHSKGLLFYCYIIGMHCAQNLCKC